jgi:hypothetical protein
MKYNKMRLHDAQWHHDLVCFCFESHDPALLSTFPPHRNALLLWIRLTKHYLVLKRNFNGEEPSYAQNHVKAAHAIIDECWTFWKSDDSANLISSVLGFHLTGKMLFEATYEFARVMVTDPGSDSWKIALQVAEKALKILRHSVVLVPQKNIQEVEKIMEDAKSSQVQTSQFWDTVV